ncbi:Serine/threonine-protein kinase PLK1 [Tritrichomonas foetus]|uniref:Serine/threonine-protein kinase PLK1 n=1 Tax=Tritrichomonas foetus TaxID=1144522 RepID=A0A1J4K7Y1_9EUKA|nr:Serine/threonine-protein kinase PLK1 [Tritrichomonas foetus]|eukprot:OHT05798.1 Serine/threonine-protein kinase PLK1 [Tritrichomonas foetus]
MGDAMPIPHNIIHLASGEIPIIYKRGEELGHGGFAKVFKAVNRSTGEEVAIKVTSRDRLKKPKAEQKHKTEVAIQMSLDHPNIVKAIDFFQDQFFTYLVLELCPGGSLKSLIRKRGSLTEYETIKFLGDILNGLCYLHDNRIIHRDLKLENFLIDRNGNLKIADFGLSAKLDYDDERKHSVCGTPNYISPELLIDAAKGISYEVDIWAVGVSAFGMLTGALPFQTKHTKDTYENIKKCNYKFPDECNLSPGAKSFIQSILQLDPDMRPTALELQYNPWLQSLKEKTRQPLSIKQQECAPEEHQEKKMKVIRNDENNMNIENIQNNVNAIHNVNEINKACNIAHANNLNQQNNIVPINNIRNVKEIDHHIENVNHANNINRNSNMVKNEFQQEKMQMPKYLVSRFCDHNGLGYLLLNGCVGACFKDGTRMILDPHQTFIQYWESYQDLYPQILDIDGSIETKKISILHKFSSSLKKTSTMFEIPTERFNRNEPMLHVKYWMRTEEVTLFRMNDRNIQLNFTDRKKLIIFWNIRKLMIVSSIHDYGILHKLHDVSKRQEGDDEKRRLDIAKQMLSIMSRGTA